MVFERIEKAEKLFERSQNLQKSRKGLSKLKRKILAQVKFLKSVRIIINQPTSLARALPLPLSTPATQATIVTTLVLFPSGF